MTTKQFHDRVLKILNDAGRWVRPELETEAKACQARIEAQGMLWDSKKNLCSVHPADAEPSQNRGLFDVR